jgi:hypothetical protein
VQVVAMVCDGIARISGGVHRTMLLRRAEDEGAQPDRLLAPRNGSHAMETIRCFVTWAARSCRSGRGSARSRKARASRAACARGGHRPKESTKRADFGADSSYLPADGDPLRLAGAGRQQSLLQRVALHLKRLDVGARVHFVGKRNLTYCWGKKKGTTKAPITSALHQNTKHEHEQSFKERNTIKRSTEWNNATQQQQQKQQKKKNNCKMQAKFARNFFRSQNLYSITTYTVHGRWLFPLA